MNIPIPLAAALLTMAVAFPLRAGIGDLEGTWKTSTNHQLTIRNLPKQTAMADAGTCLIKGTTGSAGIFTLRETSFAAVRTYGGNLTRNGSQVAMKFKPSQFEPALKAWFTRIARKQGWKVRALDVDCSTCTSPATSFASGSFRVTTRITGTFKAVINGKAAAKPYSYLHTTSFGRDPAPPSKASNPSPSNEARSVAISVVLGWSGNATSYEVHFGTSNPPPLVTTTATTSHQPATLAHNQTYFWRIDSKNSHGTTTGDVWSFTTKEPDGFLLTVLFSGTGSGTVTDSAGFTFSATGSRSYPPGTVVALTATATGGSTFTGWSGDYTSVSRTRCVVDMTAGKSVTASFARIPPAATTIFATYDNLLYNSSSNSATKNTNYSSTDLAVGATWQWWPTGYWSYDWYVSSLFFPLGEVAGKTIHSAVLKLYPRNAVVDEGFLYEIRAYTGGWYPDDITWNSGIGLTTTSEGASQSPPPASTAVPIEFDVTHIVRQWAAGIWPNYGFKLWMYQNNYGNPYDGKSHFRTAFFCSREVNDGNPNRRPQLFIQYE